MEKKKSSVGGLILNRYEGEKIIIDGGRILIEVVEIKNKAVRLAFCTDKKTSIRRFETVAQDGQQQKFDFAK